MTDEKGNFVCPDSSQETRLFQFAQVRQTACSGTEAKLDRFFELETSDDNVVTGAKVKREVIDVGLPKPPSYIPKRRQY